MKIFCVRDLITTFTITNLKNYDDSLICITPHFTIPMTNNLINGTKHT